MKELRELIESIWIFICTVAMMVFHATWIVFSMHQPLLSILILVMIGAILITIRRFEILGPCTNAALALFFYLCTTKEILFGHTLKYISEVFRLQETGVMVMVAAPNPHLWLSFQIPHSIMIKMGIENLLLLIFAGEVIRLVLALKKRDI